MKTFLEGDLQSWLKENSEWKYENNTIFADLEFMDFTEAFAFLAVIRQLSEAMDHHAKIENSGNSLRVTLTTQEAGNKVTDKDLELAGKISQWKGQMTL